MKTVTFIVGTNQAAVATAIHRVMEPFGWGLIQSKAAMEDNKVKHLDNSTAEKLKIALEDAGAEDIVIINE